ncbi:MAG: aldehyde dehydrogenase family protein, partial [Candidatus Omnitrophica bacterium]|nr:aldehyde dehydrogenase family protein [Candidatus Omnitrophota bacterium]
MTSNTIETVRCLMGGEWVDAQAEERGTVWNPSTGEVIAQVPLCGKEDVHRVVGRAGEAFRKWADTPPPDRARFLFRFREILVKETEDLARIVSREHGKTHKEAKAEIQRGIDVVEFACGIPSHSMGETMRNVAPGIDCETFRYPLGVTVGITPFNFPAMIPLWMAPVAIACGNCFVL